MEAKDKDTVLKSSVDSDGTAHFPTLAEQADASYKAGGTKKARELYEDIICPMCYRLNPQHATADYGVGCKSCSEKEYHCGKPSSSKGD